MTILDQKKALRQEMKVRKALLSAEDKLSKSEQIFAQLEQLPVFAMAKTIMAYWAMPDEVQTHAAVCRWAAAGKHIVLPVVDGCNLILREFSGVERLCAGQLCSIGEPVAGREYQPEALDLIVVPGVAFDKQGGRMGRGKGYYDRLLATTNAYKIGVCFDCQLVSVVPLEPFDVRMDAVITEV